MKVDTSFLQVPLAAAPHKPEPHPTEQASARPVDRPHHDEPANNQSPREPDSRVEKQQETPQSETAIHALRREAERGADAKSARTEGTKDRHQADHATQPQHGGFSANRTQPASVGELLDVIA
jgi:hypothetical protein